MKREWARTILTCAALLLLATIQASAADTRRVLLLHAFGHPYSPWSDMAGSFRAELIKKSPEPIDLYEVSLDTARVQSPQDEGPFVEYIRALLAGRKLDLIVPVGAPAAFFMQRHRSELFPTAPMMIVGADLRRIPGATLTDNDTGVLLDLDLPAYLKNILQLLPETTDVAVVVGNSPVERYWTSELRRDFQPFADRVKIEWFNDLTYNDMLLRAASMPQHSAIFWFLLSEDAAGVTYAQDRALERLREVSAVPVFAMGDYEFGRGIIGGPLMQTQALGQEAAAVALRILKGETPGAIDPPPVVFGAPMYDWRELRRWNISESRLPPDAIVQFREPSAWEQYRWQIALIAAVLAAQTFLIVYVLIQSRRRRAAEAEAAEQRHRSRASDARFRSRRALRHDRARDQPAAHRDPVERASGAAFAGAEIARPRRGARCHQRHRSRGQPGRRRHRQGAQSAQERREKVRAGRPQRPGHVDHRTAQQRADRPPYRGGDRSGGPPAGDVRRSGPVAAGAAQSVHERDGRDGIDGGAAAAHQSLHARARGRCRRGADQGSRPRHRAAIAGPIVQAVLHVQELTASDWG